MSDTSTAQAAGKPLNLADAFSMGVDGAGPKPPATTAGETAPVMPRANVPTPQPPEPGAPQQEQGFFSKAWDVTKGLATGLIRSPGQAVGGVMDAAQDLATVPLTAGRAKTLALPYQPGGMGDYMITQNMSHRASMADILSARKYLGDFGNNSVNQATANIASLVIGGEALAGTKAFQMLPKMVRGATAFGAATGLLQGADHADERLVNSLQALGVHSEFTDWLASNPKDESALEARFKNAVDGTIGGAVGDMVFKGARYAYKLAKGAPDAAAALKEATKAADAVVPDAAKPSEMQTQAVSGRASFTSNPASIAMEHTAEMSSIDADATKAFAAKHGRPDPAMADTAAEAQRLSAAGTPANPREVVFQVKAAGTSSDGWRTVGKMDKEDLQRFYDEAGKYTGLAHTALDVTEANAPEVFQGIGQIKLSTFNSPDDVAPFMRAILDSSPKMDRPMSDVDLNKQVAVAAAHMGLDKNATGAFLQNFANEASRLPQAVGIARANWQGMVEAVNHNAGRGVSSLNEDELRYALDTVFTARSWGAHILDIKAGLGRGLRAWQLPAINPDSYFQQFGSEEAFKGGSGILPEGQDAAGMLPPLPRNLKELDNFYKLWNAAGDDMASRAALLQGKNIIPAPGWYVRNSLANFYVGSLLAGKAIVKGFTMPAFLGAMQTVERVSGAALMAINPMVDATSRQDAGAIAKATAQSYFQTIGDFASAFRYSIQSTRNGGQTVIGGGYSAKDAAARTGPITQEMLDASQKPGDLRYQLGNAINVWPRAVFSIIGGHDELTKRLSYLGRIRMQSMVYGLRNGMKGQDLDDFVRGSLQDAVDPSTQAATYPDVLNEAARTSNMNRAQGPAVTALNFLNQSRRAVPELRYILPVLDVPASGLGEALRRLPGVSYAFQETRDDLLGNSGSIRQAEAYGRWITGATLLGTGFGMARSGLITGAGPERPSDKQAWMNMGFQPYSIKNPITGNWVSYKDWEPLGTILGIMGTAFDHSVHHAEDDQTHSAILASIAALAEYSKEKAAMQGVSNLLNFGDPDTSSSYFERLAGATASGFVPAFVRYMRNATDENLRSTKEGWWTQVLNSIPGASQSLPPLRNFLGEPVHTPNDATNLYGLLPMTFASAHHTGQDPVTDELHKIYELTGYVPPMAHPQELSRGTYDPQQIHLEDGQQMFDRFVANRMLPNPYLDGKDTHGALQTLFASDEYKSAVYGSPARAVDAVGDPSKLRMVANVFGIANKYSRAKLASESDIARKYIAVGEAKSDSPDLLRTYSADDLVKTPTLFHALGIPIDAYEDKAKAGGDEQ